MSQLSLAELKARSSAPAVAPHTEIGFTSIEGFASLQRMANMFTKSSMVPQTFQGEINLGNAAIALDMAIRMKANPLAVMQNIYIVHGRPSWSAQFLIATLNKSGKFSALRYKFQGQEGTDAWGCRAVATELATGETLEGPLITIGLAKKEGWAGKNGSKWQSMPELMLRYRAAAWFVRAYAPEIAMGLPEAEELRDTIDVTPVEVAVEEVPANPEITIEDVKAKATRSRKKKQEPQHPAEEAIMPNEESAAVEPEAILEELVPQAPAMEEQPTQEQIACPADNNENVYISYCQNSCRHYAERTCPAWDWGQE